MVVLLQNTSLMKKLVYLLFIVAALGAIGCEKKLTATEYNNKIINEQSKVLDLVLEFTAKVDSSDMKGARALLDITGVQCDSSIKIIEAMGPFEEDASFKDAAIDLFKFYKRAFAQDYKELLDIIEKEEPTMDDLDRINTIVEKVGDEEKVVDDKIQTAQKAFADKHNVKITDNSLQDKIDNLDK
jgi:hypothetical protein